MKNIIKKLFEGEIDEVEISAQKINGEVSNKEYELYDSIRNGLCKEQKNA